MVEHPAARALTGYLLVRGGVHQVAYARAVEHLTGADLMKLFPSPRIPTDKIPESQPHIERGEHTKLYRFSQEDFGEVKAVWNGIHPETGEELAVADVPHPTGAAAHDLPPQSAVFARLRAGGDRRDRPEAPAEGRVARYADWRRVRGVPGARRRPHEQSPRLAQPLRAARRAVRRAAWRGPRLSTAGRRLRTS